MALFFVAGAILLYQAIRHDGKWMMDSVMRLVALPAILIAMAGDTVMRWWAKRDKWGK